jgi:hypothetical protein
VARLPCLLIVQTESCSRTKSKIVRRPSFFFYPFPFIRFLNFRCLLDVCLCCWRGRRGRGSERLILYASTEFKGEVRDVVGMGLAFVTLERSE